MSLPKLTLSGVVLGGLAAGIIGLLILWSGNAIPSSQIGYLGFDRNEYPGNASLDTLRQTFSFAGYWLNEPPGATSNTWAGKQKALQSAGFGFLVIFDARTDTQIKASKNELVLFLAVLFVVSMTAWASCDEAEIEDVLDGGRISDLKHESDRHGGAWPIQFHTRGVHHGYICHSQY